MSEVSTARTVASLYQEHMRLYRVAQLYGDDYVVGDSHMLSQKQSHSPSLKHDGATERFRIKYIDGLKVTEKRFSYSGRGVVRSFKEAETDAKQFFDSLDREKQSVGLTANDCANKRATWSHHFKGHKTGVEFPERELEIDPYLLGLWLGDGTSASTSFTSVDKPIIDFLALKSSQYGWGLSKNEERIRYSITPGRIGGVNVGCNPLRTAMQRLDLLQNKHIPDHYLRNNREHRLALLAGFLDTDGSYTNNCYDFLQKSEVLADGVTYLARSLGFRATRSLCQKTCTNSARGRVTGTYHRIIISGAGLEELPILLPRKVAHARQLNKDATVSELKLERLGEGECYGFELVENGRILLGDFTVTNGV